MTLVELGVHHTVGQQMPGCVALNVFQNNDITNIVCCDQSRDHSRSPIAGCLFPRTCHTSVCSLRSVWVAPVIRLDPDTGIWLDEESAQLRRAGRETNSNKTISQMLETAYPIGTAIERTKWVIWAAGKDAERRKTARHARGRGGVDERQPRRLDTRTQRERGERERENAGNARTLVMNTTIHHIVHYVSSKRKTVWGQ